MNNGYRKRPSLSAKPILFIKEVFQKSFRIRKKNDRFYFKKICKRYSKRQSAN